jgi:hypothetical protein
MTEQNSHIWLYCKVIPIVIGCVRGGTVYMKRTIKQVKRIITDGMEARRLVCEMLKTALFESKSIVRKVLSGLVRED